MLNTGLVEGPVRPTPGAATILGGPVAGRARVNT